MNLLEIKNLNVEIKGKEILKNVNLKIPKGKIIALMGPNGSGKSTLANTIMGHPKNKITKGKIIFEGKDITKTTPNEKSKKGIFLSFQNPREIEGVNIKNLLKIALSEKGKKNILKSRKILKEKGKLLEMDEKFYTRSINKGFSGGEKKKMEILQLLTLNPKLAILDETDSGLDIDSLKIISKGINSFMNKNKSVLIITHYKRILEYIKPNKVIIINKGKIVKEGKPNIVDTLEKKGYKFLKNEK